MAKVFPESEWGYTSDLSANRNHHPDGQDEMMQQIAMHFHLPPNCQQQGNCRENWSKRYSLWAQMLYMTQLNQVSVAFKLGTLRLILLINAWSN